jgi:hypothetical protein
MAEAVESSGGPCRALRFACLTPGFSAGVAETRKGRPQAALSQSW